ncbi:hypothetical protein FDG2_3362 [Candidatus Protofrankia californiensis]|uniref:HAD-superfamily hydrolase n=1 Tax=Candidatus Protofrankia californiensis TaxID=1839754 RepID=A0A1C3NZK3_9ACTN|nr:hypothetical protein FDG2_3362 [Candidatus Protofrankia californiensis]
MSPVVIVDLDDTLIPDVPAAHAATGLVLRELSLPDDPGPVLDAARRTWRENPYRGHPEVQRVSSWEALWADFDDLPLPPDAASALAGHDVRAWRAALSDLKSDADLEQVAQSYRRHRRALVRPFPGAVATLDGLRARHDLWLATDGCRSLQRGKLKLAGLADRFERVFVSGEVGYPKGSHEFADVVRAALGERPVCLLAGDSVSGDLALASAGGWPAVHICGSAVCSATAEAEHTADFAGVEAFCRCSLS